MKVLQQIIFLVLIFISCSSTDKKGQQEYFEGEIHYSIEYDSIPSYMTSKDLKNVIGSKMVLIFKNGNFRKDYYSADGKLIYQRFLDLKAQKSFSESPTEDTVYWFNINKPESRTEYKLLNDTLINKYNCFKISAKTLTPNPQNSEQDLEIKSIYHSAKELAINPEWYRSYTEGNYNEIVKLTKSIVIETFDKGPFWNSRINYTKVIWRKVQNNELLVGNFKNKILKEL